VVWQKSVILHRISAVLPVLRAFDAAKTRPVPVYPWVNPPSAHPTPGYASGRSEPIFGHSRRGNRRSFRWSYQCLFHRSGVPRTVTRLRSEADGKTPAAFGGRGSW